MSGLDESFQGRDHRAFDEVGGTPQGAWDGESSESIGHSDIKDWRKHKVWGPVACAPTSLHPSWTRRYCARLERPPELFDPLMEVVPVTMETRISKSRNLDAAARTRRCLSQFLFSGDATEPSLRDGPGGGMAATAPQLSDRRRERWASSSGCHGAWRSCW